MLHGFLGNLNGWQFIIPAMGSHAHILAYDRLAFGMTERPSVMSGLNPYTQLAAEQRALSPIDSFGMEKPVLVGHSAGGNLALRLALANPGRFKALILISPAIYSNGPPSLVRFFLKSGLLERIGLNTVRKLPQQFDQFLKQAYYDPAAVPEEVIAAYRKPLKVENWDTALWEYTKAQDGANLKKHLGEIDLPILIIQGEEDQVVPAKNSIRAAKALPG